LRTNSPLRRAKKTMNDAADAFCDALCLDPQFFGVTLADRLWGWIASSVPKKRELLWI
jgi:hypothetical protein